MIPFAVEPAPFVFGGGELFATSLAVGIIFAILAPKWWKARKEAEQSQADDR